MVAPLLIAQVTDLHVVDPATDAELYVDNNRRLRDVVDAIRSEPVAIDAVIATGDLTNDSESAAFEILARELGRIEVPVLPLPGNHDERVAFRATFPDVPWSGDGHLSWQVTIGGSRGVRLIGLDTQRPGEHGAEVDDGRVRWLADALAVDHGGPTILAMHHPPFTTGLAWMDQFGFAGLDQLRRVVERSSIDLIVCGHLHRPMASTFAGVPARVGMSTVQHIALDLAPADAGHPLAVIREPVGYQIHRVEPGAEGGRGSIVTHVRYIDTGEHPIVPSWTAWS